MNKSKNQEISKTKEKQRKKRVFTKENRKKEKMTEFELILSGAVLL